MGKVICYLTGGVCLVFAAIPALIYWIVNMGVVLLFAIGMFLVLAPRFWPMMGPKLQIAVALAFGVFLVSAATLSGLMYRAGWSNTPPGGAPADAVVVLGSKVNGYEPSLMLRRRLNAAYDYLEAQPETICVVSGGQGADEITSEASVMANYLMERGIDGDRIYLEQRSVSTRENLLFSSHILEELFPEGYTVAIATDGFHQMRAGLYAKSVGITAHFSLPSSSPWGLLPSYWVREWGGILKILVLGTQR